MRTTKKVAFLVSGLLVLLGATILFALARTAQEPKIRSEQDQQAVQLIHSLQGRDLFHAYCASCHGADGRGHGPAAPALNISVPDLTTLAKREGGIFPSARVERIIAGDDLVVAHGSREMPIWGPIFHQIEEDRDFGNIRLHNVTKYLETIQQK